MLLSIIDMSKNTKLILVATQAIGTRENGLFLEIAEELGINLILFSLDNLNIHLKARDVIIELDYIEDTHHTSQFMDLVEDKYSNNEIKFITTQSGQKNVTKMVISLNLFQKPDVLVLVRRLNDQTIPSSADTDSILNTQFLNRLNKLHYLESLGFRVINSPKTIEVSMDKFYTIQKLSELEVRKISFPINSLISTISSLESFYHKNKENIVLKPLFGSKGRGIINLNVDTFNDEIRNIRNRLSSKIPYLSQPFLKHRVACLAK